MITLKIDDTLLEEIIINNNKEILNIKKEINKMTDTIEYLKERGDLENTLIVNLQQKIIDLNSETVKERKSLWDFLLGHFKKDVKSSRLTETIVVLDK